MEEILNYREIGNRLRKLRLSRKYTQEMLADAIDVSTSFIGHIERGEKKASLETVCRLALYLGTSMDYIVRGKGIQCDQESCPLYVDLKALVDSYGEDQACFPKNRAE